MQPYWVVHWDGSHQPNYFRLVKRRLSFSDVPLRIVIMEVKELNRFEITSRSTVTTYKSFPSVDFANIHKLVHCFTPWGLVSELKIVCNFCFIDRLEGDIKLSQNIEALVAAGVEKKKNRTEPVTTRGAVTNKIYLWTNGRVPYIIHSDFGEHEDFIRTWIKSCLPRRYTCVWEGYSLIESMVLAL